VVQVGAVDHVVNGVIDADGEEDDDVWQLIVTDNVVTTCEMEPGPTDTDEP
jgi:hypothetical protein